MADQPQPGRNNDTPAERSEIERLHEELLAQYPEVPPAEIAEHLQAAAREFDEVPIREFVPVLVARSAQARLSGAQARVERTAPDGA